MTDRTDTSAVGEASDHETSPRTPGDPDRSNPRIADGHAGDVGSRVGDPMDASAPVIGDLLWRALRYESTILPTNDRPNITRECLGAIIAQRDAAIAERDALRAERDKLAKFKAYVHDALDMEGVPQDPPGEHRDAGCRIGQRLEWLFDSRDMFRGDADIASHNHRAAIARAEAAEAKLAEAEKERDLAEQETDAIEYMLTRRLGGRVEGAPTGTHNYLQRVDALREIERKAKSDAAKLAAAEKQRDRLAEALEKITSGTEAGWYMKTARDALAALKRIAVVTSSEGVPTDPKLARDIAHQEARAAIASDAAAADEGEG